VFVVGALAAGVLASRPSVSVAQTTSPPAAKPPAAKSPGAAPKVQEAAVVTARGTVEAVDKEKQTVTIKGPQRTLTLHVRDPKKLDVIKVGDPVVAKYYEAVAYSVKKPGTATPGVTAQQETATSKPGQTPAGGVAQQITLTVTVVAIDKAAQTVTVNGPEGRTETVKARDPKNLDLLNVGDLVEITYTRAFAVALDKSPAK
jgi:ribosomal protein S17